MSKVLKRTFSLTAEQSAYIDRKIASGDYASGSEVIREGLRAMQAREAVVEKWLREEVVPTLAAYEADPARAVGSADLREEIKGWLESGDP